VNPQATKSSLFSINNDDYDEVLFYHQGTFLAGIISNRGMRDRFIPLGLPMAGIKGICAGQQSLKTFTMKSGGLWWYQRDALAYCQRVTQCLQIPN